MIERTYHTQKGDIHYWINAVDPSQSTLVFLPGLTADHRLFEKQIDFFAGKYNVFVWDAPGHGASRPFALNFSLMDKVEWLHAILIHENISQPVLVGQSMGGYVSQCYMQRYPGEVRAFVSIDSAPLKRCYMTGWEIWLLKHCELMYRCYPWKLLIESGSKGCATTDYGRALMRSMMQSYTPREYSRLAGHGFRILGEAIEADLPYQIDCPCLLLCGEKDQAGSAKRYNRQWTKKEGLPLVWIKAAGHNANTDAPDTVNRLIQEFIAAQ
ncbi:MAG: alpha/beta hydrolase [Eubacteriales bacterium]|nr:alpha/beta hydrolase [Eubacteriales bacterium]